MLRRLRIENLVLIREAELELAPGLNAITGETGAGKTILAQAIGLLLGARGDVSYVGPAGADAYVEAELDLPEGLLETDDELGPLAELRPPGETGIVVARRVFGDGRTRAYAWGRGVAREDLTALGERLMAMSGQFEQRRLARPSYQLEVLDGFAGVAQVDRRAALRTAWRELQAARRHLEELSRGAAAAAARVDELRALAADTDGLGAESEPMLLAQRQRLRHTGELVAAAATAAEALVPEDGQGAADLAGAASAALRPVSHLASELAHAQADLDGVQAALSETASTLRGFATSLEADPGLLEHVEDELERLADLRRRFRCTTTDELLERAETARAELAALGASGEPERAAREALAEAETRTGCLVAALSEARVAAAPELSRAVSAELRDLGMGEGELRVELRGREPSGSGAEEVIFLIRPNVGLPFAPVAETASGGELSRVALALAAAAGSSATMIFDEIDAGIGGRTANAVGRVLRRLAERGQVVTITHLPQIAGVADTHFRVEKVPGDPTHTTIHRLDDDERRAELERMLGGAEFLELLAAGTDAL